MQNESWTNSIVKAFQNLGGEAKYDELYPEIERIRQEKNIPLTTQWKASVRRTIEDHSSDSDNFRAEDLFKKLGHGYWGLRQQRVQEQKTTTNDGIYIDGIIQEKLISLKTRNQKLIIERKIQDDFTCQACGFKYKNKIIECHHLIPLSDNDNIYRSIDELITLCPNCHALAHMLLSLDKKYQQKEHLLPGLKELHDSIK